MPFISTTFLVKKRLSHSAECDKREIKTVIPLIMARAQAEAIQNRSINKEAAAQALCSGLLLMEPYCGNGGRSSSAVLSATLRKNYRSSLPENLLMT